MPHSRKKPSTQLRQITSSSEVLEASIQDTQNTIDSAYQKQKYLTEQTLETAKITAKTSSSNLQTFLLIFLICIMAIAMIAFASIAINCMISKQANNQIDKIYNSQSAQPPADNQTQISKETLDNATEINQQKKQISDLNIKIADLNFQVKKLQAQLEKEKIKSNQNQNGTLLPPNNQNNSNSHSTVPSNDKNKPNESQKPFTVRSSPRKGIPAGGPNDRYSFSISIDDIVGKSPISYTYSTPDSEWSGIKKAEYERAIRLMEVVHNVNFKGEFVFDHHNFYQTPEDKYEALSKILKEEKQFYDKKYETSKYIHDQIGICVYLPSYNNAKNRLYLRNLDSVFQQQYQNYHIVYVNDASTDGTGDFVKSYMEENGISQDKYVIINNEKNKGNCANIHMVAHNYCNQGEIMVLLDGDDALIGRQVFSLLNAVYQKQKVALTYGQFLLVRGNQISSGFSRDIPRDYLQQGTFRKLRGFFTSHLKTMYVDVMHAIKLADLQYINGTFYDYASDVAYMTPAIELVGTRLKFLKELNYEYRFDTGANEPHQQQMVVEYQVYDKAPSKKMEEMSFADNSKTVHYP